MRQGGLFNLKSYIYHADLWLVIYIDYIIGLFCDNQTSLSVI